MSKGGGGGFDTSAMEAATNRAIDLQEKIYNEGKDLSKPWYNAGSSAVGRLSDLLGLSGGSVKTRDQIYNQLLPQYTQNQSATSSYTPIKDANGITPEMRKTLSAYRPDLLNDNFTGAGGKGVQWGKAEQQVADINNFFQNYQPPSSSSIDYAGLNAAVDSQFGAQGKPDDYGALGKAFSMKDYVEDPGYQFRLQEGQKGLDRSLAARGKTFSGEAAKAAADYNSGMASQEYGNAYNRYNTDQNNLYNMLAGVSGFGQNAANSQVQQGQNYAGNVGNLTTDLANAQTSAAVAKASKPSLFSQLAGTAAQFAGSYFSDIRLKENIREIDEIDGIKRYEFNYKGSPQRYIGAMAQQVLDVIPDAVTMGEDGLYMVDYNQLPFQMSIAEDS